MKKIILVFIALFAFAGFTFAQSEVSALPEDELNVDLSRKIIIPENQHLDQNDKSGKVIIEYTPMIDEVRIVYKAMYYNYEKSYAMNAIIACLEDFKKEQNYFKYNFMTNISGDKERYYKDNRGIKWAEYSAHVKFSR